MPTGMLTELPQALATGLMLFAAGLFASSALHKLRTFTRFTGFVAGYRLIPAPLVRPASAAMVTLEVAAVPALFLPSSPAAGLPAALLLLYAGAMGVNLLRGRSNIDCGCGGAPMPLSPALVVRNLLLAAAMGWAAWLPRQAGLPLDLHPGTLAAVLGFAVGLGLFYAAFNQLQANRATLRRHQATAP